MQPDTAALSDLLIRLLDAGEEPPRELLDQILAHGAEAIPPLIAVVNEYPGDDPDADERKYWTTYHAIQLLGELRAAEAIGPILKLRDEDDDFIGRYIAESLAQIGQPAIEPLREALFARDANVYGVVSAANALARLAELSPRYRPEIVGMMIERLDADISNTDPYALRAFLISDLADMRAVEAKLAIDRAFEANLVDETVIDRETYLAIMNRPEGTSPNDALEPLMARFAPTASPGDLGAAPFGLPGGIALESAAGPSPAEVALAPAPTRRPQPFGRKVGRNESCPCGSGKKYKRCCGR
jgi:hypothetical protein